MTLLSVIAIHESGHIIAAAFFGARVSGFGAVRGGLRIRIAGNEGLSYGKELMIYLGGICFNLLSALIPGTGELFRTYSIGTAVFNLIPLRGSDGDGILASLLPMFMPSPYTSERIRSAVSEVSLLFIWCAAIILNLTGNGSLPLLIAVTLVFVSRLK